MIRYSNRLPSNLEIISESIIRKTVLYSSKTQYNKVKRITDNLIGNPDNMIVPIYDFRAYNFSNYHCSFEYDMKRLYPLSSKEKSIIDYIADFWIGNRKNVIDYAMKEWGENYSSLISFMERVIIRDDYFDLHSDNIMKDEQENYLLIDLEGFKD